MLKLFVLPMLFFCLQGMAQTDSVSVAGTSPAHEPLPERHWTLHYQATVIPQAHPDFSAGYSGDKSLLTHESPKVSLTTTLYLGRRLWKGAAAYFNPELSGGSGLSKAQGVAGFPNGETFRIGSSTPRLYLARLYLEQKFALGGETAVNKDDVNTVQTITPLRYISIRAGKFSLSDFFDNNAYSHDPRTQFLNWSLMSAGAWDYPANTRGYTIGAVTEYHTPLFAARGAITQVPKEANGPELDGKISKAFGTVAEIEKTVPLNQEQNLVIRLAGFYNQARMGNYEEAIHSILPDVTASRKYSRTKTGFYLNAEWNRQHGGYFIRLSGNDGKNETWAFTEIDRSVSAGGSFDGSRWNRDQDQWGLALVANGISGPHRRYLQSGGYGFIIGDGDLDYRTEWIAELYYVVGIKKFPVTISPDYQFVLHPAYNSQRGPVHVVGLRFHFAI